MLDAQSDGVWLRIAVTDAGIGIFQEDLPQIATEFYRAKNAKALYKKGTGLGLSIAKKIVEMHNGKLGIQTKPGHGTCISLMMPLTL